MKFIKLFVASVSTVLLLSQVVCAQWAVLGGSSEGKVPTGMNKDAFVDVSKEHANYDAIQFIHEKGLIDGYLNGRFVPDKTINRAEFTKILMKAAFAYNPELDLSGYDIYAPVGLSFSDVENQSWYIPFLRKAVEQGVVHGYADGTFRPANQVTFAEVSKIVVTSFGYEVSPETSVWYQPYVKFLADKGVIPVSIKRFDQPITRGEASEILYRLLAGVQDKPSHDYESLQKFLQTKEIIIETVTKAWQALNSMESFDYALFIEETSGENTNLLIEGTYGESADGLPMFYADLDLSTIEDMNEKAVSIKVLLRDRAVYFYLDRTVNDILYEWLYGYYDQWWRLEVPQDTMYVSETLFFYNGSQFGKLDDSLNLGKLFDSAEYVGRYEVLGEKSDHYRMDINPQGFLELMQVMSGFPFPGEPMSETELQELERELQGHRLGLEISVNDKGILNRFSGTAKNDSGYVFKFTLALGSFNEPFDVEAPLNAELFPIDDFIPALGMM